jgi:thymidylate synthase
MKQYLDLLQHVLEHGVEKSDRTGVGTISVFGYQNRYNLNDGFPAVTTKKLAWKGVVSELLWFLEGSRDERRLCEILHGTRDQNKKTIWTDNATAPYWLPKSQFVGDVGRGYGVQWRSWGAESHDQILQLIDGLKKDPNSRRHIITAWNPTDLNQIALPPCHCFMQFNVTNNKLSCQMYQRSADAFLGVPFNIASYALLTHMLAQVCDLDVGEFIHSFGDLHIYKNHIDAVKIQLNREPKSLPKLILNPKVKSIGEFKMEDFNLVEYFPAEPIQVKMAI